MKMYEPWFNDSEEVLRNDRWPTDVEESSKHEADYENATVFLLHKHSVYTPLVRLANRLYVSTPVEN